MLKRIILSGLVVLLLWPAAASAQRAGRREELRDKVRAFRIASIVQILDLDEQGAAKLSVVLNRSYDEIAAIARDSGAARRELRGLLAGGQGVDAARVNALLDRLAANRAKIDAAQGALVHDVRRVLPPPQAARLVLALPGIEQEIRQRIVRAARGRAGRQGSGIGTDPDEESLEAQ